MSTTQRPPGGTQPLSGLKVLDFSVQLPGPMTSLFLAEAGATVVKVERPGTGDIARLSAAKGENVEFALINRGKKSIVLDLKSEQGLAAARRLASQADVLIEQFRPGVMDRLGLGHEAMLALNPGLVYCAITGFGQSGELAQRAGHDLNYMALCGLLSISADASGKPVLPPTQLADIGAGSYPAAINILLALKQRDATGRGCFLDIAMTDNIFTWIRRGLAPVFQGKPGFATGQHPSAGGLARYNIYASRDGVHYSVAAVEEAFWQRLCDLVGLPADSRNDSADPVRVKTAFAAAFAQRTAAEWEQRLHGEDVCVERVRSIPEAVATPHFQQRGVFSAQLALHDGRSISALPVPVDPAFRAASSAGYPALGESDEAAADLWRQP
ncbi:MAG: CaiB/BaiF CoA-transferase family protein [Burkholderiaceae bacterium]|nr:CaiB/BaiF CoA-transferase family protein [Burkholderiaceae bacterium]